MIVELRIFGIAAVLGLSATWLMYATSKQATAPASTTAPAAATTTAPQGPAQQASGAVLPAQAPPTKTAEDRSRQLELPDGSTMPTLNDAIDAAPLKQFWGAFPWSPIVGIERSEAGLDWYRHADGSYSTTQMVWRSDLGRMAAMTRVAHPGPTPTTTAPAR